MRADLTFDQIIVGRRSVRRFTERPVARADLLALIEAACWAPSPHGTQPWRFAVLSTAAPKQRLAAAMADEWRRQLALDGQDADVVDERVRISRLRITSAPVVIVPCLFGGDLDRYPDPLRQQAELTMATQSLGCAVQNLLLAAYARGLDAGWMCAPLFCPETVVAALGLDESLIPHALIPVGYAAQDPARRPRRPLAELMIEVE